MLIFADSVWHITSAFIAFLLGIFIIIYIHQIVRLSSKIMFYLYIWHTIICMYYFWYSLNNTADSTLYYLRSLTYENGLDVGTKGIYALASLFSAGLGMSYGGVFLIFNIFGVVGLLFFAAALVETTWFLSRWCKSLALLVLFLPGLSFWSSAIGKDSLSFMGTGLLCWAALDMRRRYLAIIISILVFLLARPHIAGVLLISLFIASTIAMNMSIVKRIGLLAVLMPIVVAGLTFGLQYAGLGGVQSIEDVETYIDRRQGYNMGGGSSIDIASMSVPMRVFSYMFRPLPIEASGLLGLVVSLENTLLILIVFYAVCRAVKAPSVIDRSARMFLLVFSIISLMILANTTANLGIAIRQKWMFSPMLIVMGFSYFPRAPKGSAVWRWREPPLSFTIARNNFRERPFIIVRDGRR